MTRPLRMGILGCARICRRGMIAGIRDSGVATLEAIASRNPETSAAWAAEFNIPRHYGSYEELIADRELDAVYIPLPNELHLPWTLAAADAGKHILCEKPLALDRAEARRMVEHCQERGVVLMEAFMWRHHPRVVRAKQMVDAGELGELRLIKMDFSFAIGDDWRLNRGRGGGALFDLGCYGINAARLFTGQEPIEHHVWVRLGSSGVDMTAAITLRFESGALALLDCSFEAPDRNRLEIVGTRGVIELPDGVLPTAESGIVLRTEKGVETIAVPAANQYAEQVKAFAAGVREGRLPAPAENGLANMAVVDGVLNAIHA